jgi:hypothetical protein
MKYLISSVTIGACLLLSSAGDVFAQATINNPHGGPAMGKGQLGTGGTGVAGCGGTAAVAKQPSPLGQMGNLNTHSPFPTSPSGTNPGSAASKYAGMGNGEYGANITPSNPSGAPNTHANSQYDNACLRQQLH